MINCKKYVFKYLKKYLPELMRNEIKMSVFKGTRRSIIIKVIIDWPLYKYFKIFRKNY